MRHVNSVCLHSTGNEVAIDLILYFCSNDGILFPVREFFWRGGGVSYPI